MRLPGIFIGATRVVHRHDARRQIRTERRYRVPQVCREGRNPASAGQRIANHRDARGATPRQHLDDLAGFRRRRDGGSGGSTVHARCAIPQQGCDRLRPRIGDQDASRREDRLFATALSASMKIAPPTAVSAEPICPFPSITRIQAS